MSELSKAYLKKPSELKFSVLALLLHLSEKPLESFLPESVGVGQSLQQFVKAAQDHSALEFTSEEIEQYYEGWGNFSSGTSSASEQSDVDDLPVPMEIISEQPRAQVEQPAPDDYLDAIFGALPSGPLAAPSRSVDKSSSTIVRSDPHSSISQRYASSMQAIEARSASQRGILMHWPYRTVTEAEVLNQLFMAFYGVNTEFFEYKPIAGYRQVAPLQLSHLTPHALEQALRYYLDFASALNFIRETVEQCSRQSSLIVQAFGQACQEFVSEVKFAIVKLQKEFAVHFQVVPASSFDLESVSLISLITLRVKLHEWKTLVAQLHSTIKKSLLDIAEPKSEPEGEAAELDASTKQYSTAYRSNFLITCLYTLLKENSELMDIAATQLSIKLLLKTLEPLLAMLNSWVALGELWDPANEFMVFQVKQLQGSNYTTWKENYQIRTQELDSVRGK